MAHLIARGERTAGAVLVKTAFMNGRASLHARIPDAESGLVWTPEVQDAPEAEVDAAIARRRRRDPDLWVVEVEDRHGRHMLDTAGLGE